MKASWSILLTALFTLVRADMPLYERLEELSSAKDFATFVDDQRAFALYRESLRQYYGDENFSCEKLDSVLADFQTLRKKVAGVDAEVWKKPAAFPVLSLTLVNQAEPFTVRPLRGLHALWFDTHAMGCGQSICEMADPGAPERWAAVLKGAQYFAVEQGGKFTGTMYLLVPVTQDGDVRGGFWSMESGNVPKTLADEWLEKIQPSLPKEWKGVARKLAGTRPADAAADAIHMALPRRCFGVKESRGSNLLAGMASREPSSASGLKLDFSNPGTVAGLLNDFKSPDQVGKIADVAAEELGALKKSLGGVLISDPDPKKRFKAADALSWLGQPTKPVNLPALGVSPGLVSNYRVSPSEITPLLDRALKDTSTLVRGAAGVGLSALGAKSPAITNAMQGLLGKNLQGPGSGSNSDSTSRASPEDVGDLMRRGARGILNGGGSLDGRQLGRLFDAAERMPEGDAKQKMVETMANAYMKARDPGSAMKFAQQYFLQDPALMKEVADYSNKIDCPKLPAYEQEVQRRRQNEMSNTPKGEP